MTHDQEFKYFLKNEQEFIIRLKNSRPSLLGRKNVKRKQGNQIRIVVLDPGHKSLKAGINNNLPTRKTNNKCCYNHKRPLE